MTSSLSLRWLVATPAFHHWHRAAEPQAIDKNFSVHSPLWDWLFGTFYLPARWPIAYGLCGPSDVSLSWVLQFVYSFRRRAKESALKAVSRTGQMGVAAESSFRPRDDLVSLCVRSLHSTGVPMLNKDQEARLLAEAHYRVEAGIKTIFRITAPDETRSNEPIKLLEVNEFTSPSGIMPLQFGPVPASGIHFPSVIVEVTPQEFHQLERRELTLPNGWIIGEPVPRPVDAGAA